MQRIDNEATNGDPSTPQIAGTVPIVAELEPGTYYWCSCGRSQGQPYCDGSHAGTTFTPVEVKIEKTERVAFCTCKHSALGARCDGAHRDWK